jgi:hypothetical protein
MSDFSRNTQYARRRTSKIRGYFFYKTNPIYAVFGPKTAISPKNEPKTNPIKPNLGLLKKGML